MTKLEHIRRDAGLSQEALAEKSGVSRGVIVRIERGGIGTVQCRMIFMLAAALSVEPQELI